MVVERNHLRPRRHRAMLIRNLIRIINFANVNVFQAIDGLLSEAHQHKPNGIVNDSLPRSVIHHVL